MAYNKVVTAASTQTAFDLALQLKGSVDEVFTLIEENPDIEDVENDITGISISYELNDTFVQKFYLKQGVSVASKPAQYLNSAGAKLLISKNENLLIDNTYKLLI